MWQSILRRPSRSAPASRSTSCITRCNSIGNQKIDTNTRKPVVHYKLTAERDATDHIEFLFRATIDVPEGGTFNRNWLITARKDADTWKVSNFDDYE